MTQWHDHGAAKVLLRLAGLCLLPSAWALARLLHRQMAASGVHAATPVEFLIAASAFLCASAAAALILFGPALWKPVMLAPRWAAQRPARAGATRQTVLDTSSATSSARPAGS